MEPLPDNFHSLDHAQKDELIFLLHGAVVRLEKRVSELEGQLSKHSGNSSKPSSTDGLDKPSPKPRRNGSGKSGGDQKGYRGSTLKRVAEHGHRIDHGPGRCAGCGEALDGASVVAEQRSQVFDLPPVAIEVTEHRALTRRGSCGTCTSGAFPIGVTHPVQYGPRLHATVVYLAEYQLVQMARLTEVLHDLFGLTLSQGTVNTLLARCSDWLENFEARAIAAVRAVPAAHFDESRVRVGGKLHWLARGEHPVRDLLPDRRQARHQGDSASCAWSKATPATRCSTTGGRTSPSRGCCTSCATPTTLRILCRSTSSTTRGGRSG